MKFLILLLMCGSAFAGDFTVMGGVSIFKPPGNGTYWNNNQPYDNFMTPAAFALRYDGEKKDTYSFGMQYTHFGEVKIDALAVSTDEPYPGGFISGNSTCVGKCAPLYRWRMHSDTQSIAFIGTKHFGKWSIETGLNVYEVKTGGNVPDIPYNYPEARYLGVMPMFGAGYQDGPWSVRAQVWFMPGPGVTPPAFNESGNLTILVGYTL